MNQAEKKFWSNVNKKGPKVSKYVLDLYPELEGTRCHVWTGRTNGQGYGQFSYEGKAWLSHRLAYVLQFGFDVILRKMGVFHKCDNPPCVNWKHLFHGNAKMNSVDAVMKGRSGRSSREWEK